MSNGRGFFSETSKKDWALAAQRELNGEDPLGKLSFSNGDLLLLPYYDASDLATSRRASDIRPGKGWVNAPKVSVHHAQTANREALEHLESGADGILFDISDPEASIEGLLSGIELSFCSVFFCGNITSGLLSSFAQFAAARFDRMQLKGAAYGLSSNDLVSLKPVMTGFEQFTTLGLLHEAAPVDAEALSGLLMTLTDRLSALHPRPHLQDAAVLISLSDDFFGELIRMRALDTLWGCICAAYGRPDATLMIHGWSKASPAADYEPHGNMISSVSRAVSAVLGGSHVISTDPAQADTLQARIARNISFILRDESQLARVANPADGSYFIETAAAKLAEDAWRRFQTSSTR